MAGTTPPSGIGDGAPLARAGEVLAGKFRIERVLGQGGMGVVVAARHLQLDETVALKFLRAHATADPEALARFTREARAAAKLKSEHVARVLDAGVTDEGTPYIVMEYLEGRTLGQLLQNEGRLDVSTTAEFAIQACEGLAEAHARGIVHRDIKPENLFLVERSQGWRVVKILDFGISKFDVARGASESNISTQSMMGSPCYMSPEQLRSTASVDHRTDIWSLGATMFELLSGGTPYPSGQSLPQLIANILEQPAPRLADFWRDIPADLSAIVARCMAKDREQRFASAAELALALLPYAPKRARSNVERAIAVTQASSPSSVSARLWTDAPPPNSFGELAPIVPMPGTLRSATSQKATDGQQNLDTLAAPTMPVSGEKKRSRSPAVAMVVGSIGVLLALVWHFASQGPAAVAPPSESTLPATAQRADPEALPPSPSSATPAVSAPLELEAQMQASPASPDLAASAAPSASGARPPLRPGQPAHHVPASSSSNAPASLDIRMER